MERRRDLWILQMLTKGNKLEKKKKQNSCRAGEINQQVKRLPNKREDPCSVPRTHIEMLGKVACAGNPNTREAEIGRSLGFDGHLA